MNTEMYRRFFEIQKKHWWFVTKKRIVLDLVSRYLPEGNQKKVLDIGCGSGLMLNALESIGETYGMDTSDEAIEFSKEIFCGEIVKGKLPDDLPFERDFFNLITALDVVEHVDQDLDSLMSIQACLAENGKAIITVPAYMFLWSRFDELNHHKRRYTSKELKMKLVRAGFEVEKISYYNTLLFPIVFGVRVLNNILNRDGSSDIDMPNRFLNSVLRNIFGLEMYLLRYLDFPFGVSILTVVRKKFPDNNQ